MKSFVHIATWIIALGLAGLLTGCASHSSPRTARQNAHDFEVVETNSKRLLTPQEMEFLRHEVLKFLEKEGAVASGDYYVKIFLAPDQNGIASEWVVVRFTRDTEMRYSLLGSYAANSYNTRSYAAYDYYPYGYDNFSRISFQYYDDPFYGSHYYFPPRSRHNRDRDHDRNHDGDRDRDRDKDRDGEHARSPVQGRFKPIPAVESSPVNRTRRDGNNIGRNDQSGDNNFPHRAGTPGRSGERNREANTGSTARSESPRNDSTRGREQSYPRHGGAPVGQSERSAEYRRDSGSPSPVRSEAPARSESVSRSTSYTPSVSRSESSHSSRSEPSYSAPARSESSSRSVESTQSQKESNQAAAQRERLE